MMNKFVIEKNRLRKQIMKKDEQIVQLKKLIDLTFADPEELPPGTDNHVDVSDQTESAIASDVPVTPQKSKKRKHTVRQQTPKKRVSKRTPSKK